MRFFIGILFLAVQLASIGYARFVPARYFCWAPYDSINEYEMTVKTPPGLELSQTGIRDRYRIPQKGRDNRAIEHVIRIIRQREKNAAEDFKVLLTYRTNGREWKTWEWPEISL